MIQIALLRGVMPSGRTRVPMAELRVLLGDLGFAGARTWIASGNAVFRDPAGRDRAALEALLEREIARAIGPALDVMTRTAAEWEAILAANPFPDDAVERPNKLLVTALKATPSEAGARAFEGLARAPDRCRVVGDTAYLTFTDAGSLKGYTPAAYRRTLGCSGTGRNWNTAVKLAAMARELAAAV